MLYIKTKYQIEEPEKIARETIRITIDRDTKEEDLNRLVKVLKEIYYKYKNKFYTILYFIYIL